MSAALTRIKTLSDLVVAMGEEKFSKKYGVSIRAAQSYRWRTRVPRRKIAQRIVEDNANPLGWAEVLAPIEPKSTRRRRRG